MASSRDLRRIVMEYEPKIRRFFLRRSASQEDAEDLTQTAVMAVLEGYPRFQGRSSLSTWVYSVCRNTLNHHYYYRRRDLDLLERLKKNLPDRQREPNLDLRSVLELLRPRERKLYEEFYVEGRTIREIATRTNTPEGTVKYRLYELRKRVRSLFG